MWIRVFGARSWKGLGDLVDGEALTWRLVEGATAAPGGSRGGPDRLGGPPPRRVGVQDTSRQGRYPQQPQDGGGTALGRVFAGEHHLVEVADSPPELASVALGAVRQLCASTTI